MNHEDNLNMNLQSNIKKKWLWGRSAAILNDVKYSIWLSLRAS